MARGRMLNKSISASVKLQNLPDDTCRLMATWIISHLDKHGVFYGEAVMVKSFIFPRRADVTLEQVEGYLSKMCSIGLIEIFESGGQKWQYWPGFQDNQIGLRADRESTEFPLPPNHNDDGEDDNPPQDTPPNGDGIANDDYRKDAGNLPESIPPNRSISLKEDNINITTTTPAQELSAYFSSKTNKNPKGPIESQSWDDDCQDILDKAKGSIDRAKELIDESIAILEELGYPRNKPAGLLVTIDNLLKPKPKRNNGARNGHSGRNQQSESKPKGRTGADLAAEPYYDPATNEHVYPDGRRELVGV